MKLTQDCALSDVLLINSLETFWGWPSLTSGPPPTPPLTCEPGCHKPLTTTTNVLVKSHTQALPQKYIHIHSHTAAPPRSIIIAFSTSRTTSEGRYSRSITVCLVYRQWEYVLICTVSQCRFDLTEGMSVGSYHTFVKYCLTPILLPYICNRYGALTEIHTGACMDAGPGYDFNLYRAT